MGRPPAAALLVLAATYLFNLLRFRSSTLDDAYISLRYARNLAEGNGPVFNLGEYVEGYTNFLLVVIEAGFMRLGVAADTAVTWISVAASLLLLWLVARLDRVGDGSLPKGFVLTPAVLLLAPLEMFGYWASAGLETMLFTALLVGAVDLLVAERRAGALRGSGLVFALLALTRPEGVLLFGVCSSAFLAEEALEARRKSRTGSRGPVKPTGPLLLPIWRLVRRGAANLAGFLAVYGPYFAWRSNYYGYPFPNTFYAKVAGGRAQLVGGLDYLGQWATSHPVEAAALACPIAVVACGWRDDRLSRVPFWPLWTVVVVYVVYIVTVGGDSMPYYRFFLPILPLCCLLCSWSFSAIGLLRPGTRSWRASAILLLLANPLPSYLDEQVQRAFVADRTAVTGRYVGLWLADHLGEDDLVAVNTAGTVPYYARVPVIDTLGLNDAEIAHRPVMIVSEGWTGHRRGWGEYVMSRRPRIVLWYNAAGARDPHYLGDHELADSPFFRFFYNVKQVTIDRGALGTGEHSRTRALFAFAGDAFDLGESAPVVMPDLGVRLELRKQPLRHTLAFEAPVVVNYFEFEERYLEFWTMRHGFFGDARGFVDAVADTWAAGRAEQAGGTSGLRAEVERIAVRAHAAFRDGRAEQARRLITSALARNAEARSPLVYQYAANLAALEDNLLLALWAQKLAMELDPANELYRHNLTSLLTVPFNQDRPAESRAIGARRLSVLPRLSRSARSSPRSYLPDHRG